MKLSGFGSPSNVRFFWFCSASWAGWASRRLVHTVHEGLAAERI
jgi:hypothetical protein